MLPDRNTYAQYTLVYANRLGKVCIAISFSLLALIALVIKIPLSLSFDRASTIPLAVATAAIGLTQLYTDNIRFDKMTALMGGAPSFSYEKSDTKAFWENGAEGSQSGQPLLVLGGTSAVGQFG